MIRWRLRSVNESWSMGVLWAGAAVAIVCGIIGFDRWYERRHPSGLR
jgi:hypothetical protein